MYLAWLMIVAVFRKRYGRILKDLKGVLPLMHNDSTYCDSLTKATIFNNYFASIFTEEDSSTIPTQSSQPLYT